MNSCPIRNEQYKELALVFGEETVNALYAKNNDVLPTLEQAFDLLDNKPIADNNIYLSSSIPAELAGMISDFELMDTFAQDANDFLEKEVIRYNSRPSNTTTSIPLTSSPKKRVSNKVEITGDNIKSSLDKFMQSLSKKKTMINNEIRLIQAKNKQGELSLTDKNKLAKLKEEMAHLNKLTAIRADVEYERVGAKSLNRFDFKGKVEVAKLNSTLNKLVDGLEGMLTEITTQAAAGVPTVASIQSFSDLADILVNFTRVEEGSNHTLITGITSQTELDNFLKLPENAELKNIFRDVEEKVLLMKEKVKDIKLNSLIKLADQAGTETITDQATLDQYRKDIVDQFSGKVAHQDISVFDYFLSSIDQTVSVDTYHTKLAMKIIYNNNANNQAEATRMKLELRKRYEEVKKTTSDPGAFFESLLEKDENGRKSNRLISKLKPSFNRAKGKVLSTINDKDPKAKFASNILNAMTLLKNNTVKVVENGKVVEKSAPLEYLDYERFVDYDKSTVDNIVFLDNEYTKKLNLLIGNYLYKDMQNKVKATFIAEYFDEKGNLKKDDIINPYSFTTKGTQAEFEKLILKARTTKSKADMANLLIVIPTTNDYDNGAYNKIQSNKAQADYLDYLTECADVIKIIAPEQYSKWIGSNSLFIIDEEISDNMFSVFKSDIDGKWFPKGWASTLKSNLVKSLTVKDDSYLTPEELKEVSSDEFSGQTNFTNSLSKKERSLIESYLGYNKEEMKKAKLDTILRNEYATRRLYGYLGLEYNASDTKVNDKGIYTNEKLRSFLLLNYQFENEINLNSIINTYAKSMYYQDKKMNLQISTEYFLDIAFGYNANQKAKSVIDDIMDNYRDIKSAGTSRAGSLLTYRMSGDEQERLTKLESRQLAIDRMEEWYNRVILRRDTYKEMGNLMNSIYGFNRFFMSKENKQKFNALNKEILDIKKKLKTTTDSAELDTLKTELNDKENELMDLRARTNKGAIITPGATKLIEEFQQAITDLKDLKAKANGSPKYDKSIAELEQKINEISVKNSRVFTVSSVVRGLLGLLRLKALGWNLNSGVTNYLEGQISNYLMASTEEFFPQEYFWEAKAISMFGPEWKKVNTLMNRYEVVQDTMNELGRAKLANTDQDLYSKSKSKLQPFYITHQIEIINQYPLMVAMMKGTMIKDKQGNESQLWEALDDNGLLLPEFDTIENQQWVNGNGQEYANFKYKLGDCISRAHGNYDDLRGMLAKSSLTGQILIMFKSWFPNAIVTRFGEEQVMLSSGKATKGRYRSLSYASGATMGLIAGGVMFGPIGLLAGSAIGALTGSGYIGSMLSGSSKGVGISNVRARDEAKAVLKGTLQEFGNFLIRVSIGSFADSKSSIHKGAFDTKKTFADIGMSDLDVRNMTANMADLAMIIKYGLASFLMQAMWEGLKEEGEDDDDEEAKNPFLMPFKNYVINKADQIMGQATSYTNPIALYEMITSGAAIQFSKDIIDVTDKLFSKDIIDLYDDVYISGKYAGENKMWHALSKAFLPSVAKSSAEFLTGNSSVMSVIPNAVGFEKISKEQFDEESYWKKFFESDVDQLETEIKTDRAVLKKELEEEGVLTTEEIKTKVDEEIPSVSKQQEDYEKAAFKGKLPTKEDAEDKLLRAKINREIKEEIRDGSIDIPNKKVDLKKIMGERYEDASEEYKDYITKKILEKEAFNIEQAKRFKEAKLNKFIMIPNDPNPNKEKVKPNEFYK